MNRRQVLQSVIIPFIPGMAFANQTKQQKLKYITHISWMNDFEAHFRETHHNMWAEMMAYQFTDHYNISVADLVPAIAQASSIQRDLRLEPYNMRTMKVLTNVQHKARYYLVAWTHGADLADQVIWTN